jgi:hypothetical protein
MIRRPPRTPRTSARRTPRKETQLRLAAQEAEAPGRHPDQLPPPVMAPPVVDASRPDPAIRPDEGADASLADDPLPPPRQTSDDEDAWMETVGQVFQACLLLYVYVLATLIFIQ